MSYGYWEELERPGPESVNVAGRELRAGSRVRLHPNPGGDIWDIALNGRAAIVERRLDRCHVRIEHGGE